MLNWIAGLLFAGPAAPVNNTAEVLETDIQKTNDIIRNRLTREPLANLMATSPQKGNIDRDALRKFKY